jgi:hypothetical protein
MPPGINSNMPSAMDRTQVPYNTPGVRTGPPEANTNNNTTEGDLQTVYDQMDYQAGDDTDTDQDEWPETVEEFKLKFGREPATDEEMEFYYGDMDEQSKAEEIDRATRR